MNRTDVQRLEDARERLAAISALVARLPLQHILDTRELRQSVILDILVLAEALGRISNDVQGLARDVPWRAIADTRNRLIHSYWSIDPAVLSNLLQMELPSLLEPLDELLLIVNADT